MSNLTLLSNPDQLNPILQTSAVVVLYFTTPQCSVCTAVFPQLEALVEKTNYPLIKIDGSKFPEVAGQYIVFTVPTILVMFEGKEVLRESRFIDFNKIERILNLLND